MIKSNFVFLEDPEIKNGVFILQTTPPFYIAKVWYFMSREMAWGFEKRSETLCVEVPGYNVLLHIAGALKEDKKDFNKEHDTLNAMSEFFLKYRIKQNESRFKRYKREK